MDIYQIIHRIQKSATLLILVPLITIVLTLLLTQNQQKKYNTWASVFTGITSGTSLDNPGGNRVDYFATKTAYNNLLSILNSKSVKEETALRLLTEHLLLNNPDPAIISEKSYNELQKITPNNIRELVVKNSPGITYENLKANITQNNNNFLYGLLNLNHPHYSHKAISQIKALQQDGSDVIKLSYSSDDPAIAYHTLSIIIDVFLDRYKLLKKNQSEAIVEYFERQLKLSSVKLNKAEDRLLEFNKNNNIINYYEQTKHISSQQEKIEVKLQEVLMEFQAASAVLQKLETETQNRFNVNLKNKEILELRKEIIKVSEAIASYEMEKGEAFYSSELYKKLRDESLELKLQVRQKLDMLYVYEHNSQGLAIETILFDWLKTLMDYESSKARLQAMRQKREEFNALYTQFAPLGATLKRIEREIEVKEKAYLEILHHLGLAKLKQQNDALKSNMKILDTPYFPIDPEPTKRKIFIIVAGMFGFILTLLGLLVHDLLDKTLKTVSRFQHLTKLSVLGAFSNNTNLTKQQLKLLNKKGIKPLVEKIVSLAHRNNANLNINLLGFYEKDGVYELGQLIKEHLTTLDYKVDLSTDSVAGQSANSELSCSIHIRTIENISAEIVSPFVYETAHLNIVSANAQRIWGKADSRLLETIEKYSNNNIAGSLAFVLPENMEDVVDEVPKQRSHFRKYLKYRIFKRFIA